MCIFAFIGLVMVVGFVAIQLRWTKTEGVVDAQHDYFKEKIAKNLEWEKSEEWKALKVAILKDKEDILKASESSGVGTRLIIAPLVVEQLRLYESNRELFKEFFSPLKMLGSQNQFSWGVMGIKEESARQIEQNLKNANSPFYLGPAYEHILDFTSDSPDSERFQRLTDDASRYYSYLYAGLYEKQLIAQWDKAGIPIHDRPEIVFTLFNIGFSNSRPHPNPSVGGAEIRFAGKEYSFGGLAFEFYYSDELPEFEK